MEQGRRGQGEDTLQNTGQTERDWDWNENVAVGIQDVQLLDQCVTFLCGVVLVYSGALVTASCGLFCISTDSKKEFCL